MVRIAFGTADETMPRTAFYDALCAALRAQPGFVSDPAAADLLIPAEDTAHETNWPRYGRPASAYLRGAFDSDRHVAYLERVRDDDRPVCVVSMYPYFRVPAMMAVAPQVVVADVNLRTWERSANPRTISMPAPPLITGWFDPAAKTVLASFRGVASHPCRKALAAVADGAAIRVELVDRAHVGRIDAAAGLADPAYAALLHASIFAFVPRGDMEFSYRLVEAMSFGCVPIIIADGLVPPFDRSIDWQNVAVQVPQSRIPQLPTILSRFSAEQIAAMQTALVAAHQRCLSGLDRVAATLIAEAAVILTPGAGAGSLALCGEGSDDDR